MSDRRPRRSSARQRGTSARDPAVRSRAAGRPAAETRTPSSDARREAKGAPPHARRRATALVAVVIVVAGALALAHHLQSHPAAAGAARAPAAPVHFSVGIATCTFVDHTRFTQDYATRTEIPERILKTEIRYPTISPVPGVAETPNANPARRHGPFPLVVFGHGYDLDPDDYASLLDTWVRAGMVVAAPIFPDTNSTVVSALGNITAPEEDDVNQPGDVAFVTHALLSSSATPSAACAVVGHLIDSHDVALAGQSDGASTVDALAYASAYAAGPLPARAVVSLSGSEMETAAGEPAGYGARPGDPALLVVQSATDQCNPPQNSVALYEAVDQPDRWFLTLHSGDHLPPYTDQPEPVDDFAVVAKVTTAFLRLELEGTAPPATSSHERPDVAFDRLGNTSPSIATLTTGPAPTLTQLVQSALACYLS